MNFFYRCFSCGKEYEILPGRMLCDDCAKRQTPDSPPEGILEVRWKNAPEWKNNFDLLPVHRQYFIPLPVGGTRVWKSERLKKKYGFENLWLKNESTNLTGSLKDRASYLVAAFARQHNINEVIVASTGNAGSSMAGIGAAYGLKVNLFVPEKAPKAKLIQARQYGAIMHLVKGNYDLAFKEAMRAAEGKRGVINRNTAVNPLTIEGKKTVALELYRQLHVSPDVVFVPVGDGVILAGVYKGFEDLLLLGVIDKIPKIIAVQAEGSAAIYEAFKQGTFSPFSSKTIADSIAVDIPANGRMAVEKLKKHEGDCILVSDEEIMDAQFELSKLSGLFAEPAAASAFAGFKKICERIEKGQTVVLLITGNGLKDIEAAGKTNYT